MCNNQGFLYPVLFKVVFWDYGKNYSVPKRDTRNSPKKYSKKDLFVSNNMIRSVNFLKRL